MSKHTFDTEIEFHYYKHARHSLYVMVEYQTQWRPAEPSVGIKDDYCTGTRILRVTDMRGNDITAKLEAQFPDEYDTLMEDAELDYLGEK